MYSGTILSFTSWKKNFLTMSFIIILFKLANNRGKITYHTFHSNIFFQGCATDCQKGEGLVLPDRARVRVHVEKVDSELSKMKVIVFSISYFLRREKSRITLNYIGSISSFSNWKKIFF